ncbi:MAG: hypothetical protein MR932_02230 [Treponema porcinum]|nr:hypothetical protein [Treponema porcinum]
MKKLSALLFFMFLSVAIFAQSNSNRQTTTIFPQNGKYEIITSSLAFRYTFLLNRENGDTWQLVSTSTGYMWQKIYKNKNSLDKVPENFKGAVYQITMSGMAAKGMYLTNTLTGATWTLYSDSDTGELFWGIIDFPE